MKKHRYQTLQNATDAQYLLLEDQMVKAVPISTPLDHTQFGILVPREPQFGILVPRELLQKFFHEKNVVLTEAFWAFWCSDAETAKHVYSRLKSDDLAQGRITINNKQINLIGLLVDYWTFQIVECK